MGKLAKVRMNVSIASADWSYQPNQVIEIDKNLARQWIAAGHAVAVNGNAPVTSFDQVDGLRDLSMEEARARTCVNCEHRAAYVLKDKAYCPQHYRAELES